MKQPRHRPELRELLDGPAVDGATLDRNLHDIRRLNRWLGWNRTVLRELSREARHIGTTRWRLLDVATGSADLPVAAARWGRRRGWQPRIVALDLSAEVLASAVRTVAGRDGIAFVRGDALRLPFKDAAIDFVTCALALHHFAPAEAVALLRELGRVTAGALILSDLERSWPGYIGARLLRLVTRNPMTRHDAPVSVLRAYTAGELGALARAAGLDGARVRRQFPMRLALTWRCPRAASHRSPARAHE